MAFAATMSTDSGLERAWSVGPIKFRTFTYTAVSGDTGGTVTIPEFTTVKGIIMDGGLVHSALPTFSGNVATLAFVNPAANRFGTGIAFGV